MIAPDANLLIFAHNPGSPFYKVSRIWFEDILSSSELVGIPIFCVLAFLRFVTNPKIAQKPISFSDGYAIVESWLAFPHVRILYPGDQHWQLLQQLSRQTPLRGDLITDAAIAATAQEYGATVHSHDRDFARFPGIRRHDPLA